MPSLDQLPVKEMNEVNWEKITEDQAQGFGLSLSFFNDAVEIRNKLKAVFLARLMSLVTATIVGTVMLTWESPTAAVAGIVGALSLGTLASWWQAHRKEVLVKEASKSLTEDVMQLPKSE